MSTTLKLGGFDELKAALRNLPAHLAQEAGGIVNGHAEAAASQIRGRYKQKTGALVRGVKVDRATASGAGAVARVRSTGRLAYIYENGTQVRHTGIGANRGAMPPAHVFIPIAIRERRAMVEDLIALLEREGLTVRRG